MFRSSLPEVFYRKGVLRNFAKFTGKHLCQSLLFNKVAGLSLLVSLGFVVDSSQKFYKGALETAFAHK